MTLSLRRAAHVLLTIAIVIYIFAPLFGAPWRPGRWDLAVVFLIYTAITAWIIGIEMRRKIRKDLGRKATDLDLTSIDTWMKVDEVEYPNKEKQL